MIGGYYGFYNVLPYIIDIFVGGGHSCSGSLIAYDWVLTAAHCVQKKQVSNYYVGAGLTVNTFNLTLHGAVKFDHGQTRRVERIYSHENFSATEMIHDIALLKVRVPFEENGGVSIVKLPLKEESDDLSSLYKYCHIGGWGRIGPNNMLIYDSKKWTYNEDGEKSTKLTHVVIPVISNEQCRRIKHRAFGLSFRVRDTQFCTLYYPGRKAACRGDSGSPLVCGSKQYGIVSWSYTCGAPRFGADVYTRVDKYLEWINKTIQSYTAVQNNDKSVVFSYEYYDTGDKYFDSSKSNQSSSWERNIPICLIFLFNSIILIIIR